MLKSTGIVRKLDELGRVVIPIETRRTLSIRVGDPLEIYSDDQTIIFKRYAPGCAFCGNMDNVTTFKGVLICETCRNELKTF